MVTINNVTYTLQSGNTAWVTGHTLGSLSSPANIIIPETITPGSTTYTVTFITANAFKNSSKLASVSIPDSIIRVLSFAFENCSQLTAVSIGNTCNSILGYAFNNCEQLSTVTIGTGLTDIGSYAFANCQSLTSMYFLGDKPGNQIAVVDQTDNVKIYYASGTNGWSSTFINRPTYPIPTINSVTSSGASISANTALSTVYVYTSTDRGTSWTTNSVAMSGGSGTFNSFLSEGTLVSTIANFYDATTYANYSKTIPKSFSFQFDCNNQVTSSTIETYLPIDNTNNSITISNITVDSNVNTHTMTIYYSCNSPIIPDGLNFNVSTSVFDYYNNKHDNKLPSKIYYDHGAKIIKLPFKFNFFGKLKKYISIKNIVEEEKPDLLYIHCIMPNMLEMLDYKKRNPKVKMIMDYHADYSNSANNWFSLNVLHKIIRKKIYLDPVRKHISRFYPIIPGSTKFLNEVYKRKGIKLKIPSSGGLRTFQEQQDLYEND